MSAETLESLLVRYFAERDERAMEELVARSRPRLLSIARRIEGGRDAEDCDVIVYQSDWIKARCRATKNLPAKGSADIARTNNEKPFGLSCSTRFLQRAESLSHQSHKKADSTQEEKVACPVQEENAPVESI